MVEHVLGRHAAGIAAVICVVACTACKSTPESSPVEASADTSEVGLADTASSAGGQASSAGGQGGAPTGASDATQATKVAGRPSPISATTKRIAQGLEEPLPGYLAWPKLDEQAIPAKVLGSYNTYVRAAGTRVSSGSSLRGPLDNGSLLLREIKAPQADFIQRIVVFYVGAESRGAESYFRGSDQEPFVKDPDYRGLHVAALEALSLADELPLAD